MSHVSPRGEALTSAEVTAVENLVALGTTPAGQALIKTGPTTFSNSGSSGGGGGFTALSATGSRNGINTVFVFSTSTQPSYIVSDGVWYTALDDNGSTQWSWSTGSKQATMIIPPNSSLFGVQ